MRDETDAPPPDGIAFPGPETEGGVRSEPRIMPINPLPGNHLDLEIGFPSAREAAPALKNNDLALG